MKKITEVNIIHKIKCSNGYGEYILDNECIQITEDISDFK